MGKEAQERAAAGVEHSSTRRAVSFERLTSLRRKPSKESSKEPSKEQTAALDQSTLRRHIAASVHLGRAGQIVAALQHCELLHPDWSAETIAAVVSFDCALLLGEDEDFEAALEVFVQLTFQSEVSNRRAVLTWQRLSGEPFAEAMMEAVATCRALPAPPELPHVERRQSSARIPSDERPAHASVRRAQSSDAVFGDGADVVPARRCSSSGGQDSTRSDEEGAAPPQALLRARKAGAARKAKAAAARAAAGAAAAVQRSPSFARATAGAAAGAAQRTPSFGRLSVRRDGKQAAAKPSTPACADYIPHTETFGRTESLRHASPVQTIAL